MECPQFLILPELLGISFLRSPIVLNLFAGLFDFIKTNKKVIEMEFSGEFLQQLVNHRIDNN